MGHVQISIASAASVQISLFIIVSSQTIPQKLSRKIFEQCLQSTHCGETIMEFVAEATARLADAT